MPLYICRGFFFANEFFIFVDLPIDIHTAMVYITYIRLITQEREQ